VPHWALSEWKEGKPYPVQFDSDKVWLARTLFPVKIDRADNPVRLSYRPSACISYSEWPDNPELREGDYLETVAEKI